MKRKLTDKQELFCQQYLVDLNATQAAIRAGYSKKTANEQGSRLLANVSVSARLAVLQEKRLKKIEVDQDYVLKTIIDTVERCKQAEPVLDREGNPTGEYKFDSNAVLKGSELLGKYLAMWTEKQQVDHKGSLEFNIREVVKFEK